MSNTLAVVSQSGESLTFLDLDTGKQTGVIRNMTAEPHEIQYEDEHGRWHTEHSDGNDRPDVDVVE